MTKRKHLLLPSTSEMLTKKDNLTKVLQLPLVPLYPYSNSVVIPPFCTIHLKALDDSPFVQPFDPISQSMSCCSDSIKGTSPSGSHGCLPRQQRQKMPNTILHNTDKRRSGLKRMLIY